MLQVLAGQFGAHGLQHVAKALALVAQPVLQHARMQVHHPGHLFEVAVAGGQ